MLARFSLTPQLIRYGFTRDSPLWFWSKLVSIATLITTGVVPLDGYVSDRWKHWILVASGIVLVLAGQYDRSPLPPGPPPAPK